MDNDELTVTDSTANPVDDDENKVGSLSAKTMKHIFTMGRWNHPSTRDN